MTGIPGRRNGFSYPYSIPQVIAWIVLLATIVEFLFFVSPAMPIAASIPVTIYFFALIAGIIYHGALTQGIDPIDLHLQKHLNLTQPEQEANKTKFYNMMNPPVPDPLPQEGDMKQCWLCDTQVSGPSMHCKFCNKCVTNFDHHCMWLNTCVGKRNYIHFFRCMCFIFVMQISHMAIQVVLLVNSWRGGKIRDLANAAYNNAGLSGVFNGIWIFFIVFDGISIFLIGQLIWMHMLLMRENLTTYSYIVRETHKRREKMRLYGDLAAKRTVEVTKAKQEGRSGDVCKLQCGGIFRLCGCGCFDPLDLPEIKENDLEGGFAASLSGGRLQSQTSGEVEIMPDPSSQNGDESNDHDNNGVQFVPVKDE